MGLCLRHIVAIIMITYSPESYKGLFHYLSIDLYALDVDKYCKYQVLREMSRAFKTSPHVAKHKHYNFVRITFIDGGATLMSL